MKFILFFIALVLFYSSSFSQEDAKGSKDHPLFNRMPGYRITNYKEREFEVYKEFMDENGNRPVLKVEYYYIYNYVN